MDDGVVAEGGEDHGKAPRFWLKETDGINHGTGWKIQETTLWFIESCQVANTQRLIWPLLNVPTISCFALGFRCSMKIFLLKMTVLIEQLSNCNYFFIISKFTPVLKPNMLLG